MDEREGEASRTTNLEDWVAKRLSCTAFEVFVQLRQGAERDVRIRNEKRGGGERVNFKLKPGEESFTVLREGPKITASVEFILIDSGISVRRGSGEIIIEASIMLNDECECGLESEGTLLTCAQFRKRALEDLLFKF